MGDNSQRLASLTTDAAGNTAINGGSVNTSGDQTYNDAVTLNATGNSTTLTGDDITFNSTLRSITNGEESLTLTATSDVTFNGAVGDNSQRLADLTVTTADDVAFNSTSQFTGAVDVNAQNNVTVNGDMTAGGLVAIDANLDGAGNESFTQSASGNITTTSNAANAVVISVGGTGNANLATITTGATGGIKITAGGSILDNNGSANNLDAQSAELIAGSGIGTGDAIESTLDNLAASSTTGVINLLNTGNLLVTTVGGTSGLTTTGNITVAAIGSLTVSQNVTSSTRQRGAVG